MREEKGERAKNGDIARCLIPTGWGGVSPENWQTGTVMDYVKLGIIGQVLPTKCSKPKPS